MVDPWWHGADQKRTINPFNKEWGTVRSILNYLMDPYVLLGSMDRTGLQVLLPLGDLAPKQAGKPGDPSKQASQSARRHAHRSHA